MRVLVIGCGSIGSVIANTLQEMSEISCITITDQDERFAEPLLTSLNKTKYVDINKINGVLDEIDLMIESASQDAAKKYVPSALEKGISVMIMSVGAFADKRFKDECYQLAKIRHATIYVPSGAICGTDGLYAASAERIDEVHLITTKGPDSLKNAPAVIDSKMNLSKLTEPTVIFEGFAEEAVTKFPKNINVAATISLLGIGFENTKVTVICDPHTKENSHVLLVKGSFGEMKCEVHNMPSPNNPSTSYLAALSAAASLKRIIGNVWIGI